MRTLIVPLIAGTLCAGPCLSADPTEADLQTALDKAKKEKKYLAVVFTLFN